jgi:hypothetical protein
VTALSGSPNSKKAFSPGRHLGGSIMKDLEPEPSN